MGAREFVITRMDKAKGRPVPIKGKLFDSLDFALDEAIRLSKLKRYAEQSLQVHVASTPTRRAKS